MRRLPSRPGLPPHTSKKIVQETFKTNTVVGAQEKISAASSRYKQARSAKWFSPVVESLKFMACEGQKCMTCSGGEAAQVEHYRPKSTYPLHAFVWENLLWICSVCNLAKGDKFDEQCRPVDPTCEDVWEYFFIDEFGNFCAVWSDRTNSLDARAVETIKLYELDRQALQETRLARLNELKRFLVDSATLKQKGQLSEEDLQQRALEFHANPLQPDVVDYFLNGPGSTEQGVAQFFAVAGL